MNRVSRILKVSFVAQIVLGLVMMSLFFFLVSPRRGEEGGVAFHVLNDNDFVDTPGGIQHQRIADPHHHPHHGHFGHHLNGDRHARVDPKFEHLALVRCPISLELSSIRHEKCLLLAGLKPLGSAVIGGATSMLVAIEEKDSGLAYSVGIAPLLPEKYTSPKEAEQEWEKCTWHDMHPVHRVLWETLGWNSSLWENEQAEPPTATVPFVELSKQQRRAVWCLGYFEMSW